MKLAISGKEIPAALDLAEQLAPGLKLDAVRSILKGLTLTGSVQVSKVLADGTFELDLSLTA